MNEIATPQLASGLALYAVVRQGQTWWSGAALEAYNAGHWATYVLAVTEGATGLYYGSFPAAAAGLYQIGIRQKPTSGSTAAATDPEILTLDGFPWDGTARVLPASAAALLDFPLAGHTAAGSVGEVLRYAGAQAGGKWIVDGSANTLKLYALDGALLTTLPLTPPGGPYVQRGS